MWGRSLYSAFYRCSSSRSSFSRVDTMFFQSPAEREEKLRHDASTFSSNTQFQNFGLVFLGSGGGKLDNTRSSPSVAVRFDKISCLVDCGNDTARELMNASMWSIPGMRASRFEHIFITHLHADHIMGILATLLVLKQSFETACPTFHLWGPVGLRKFVRSALAVTNPDISAMELCVHELVTLKEYQMYERMFMESRSEGSGPRTKFSIPLNPCGDTLILQNPKTKAWDLISPQKSALPRPPWSHYQPSPPPKIPNVAVTAGEIRHTVRTHGFVFEEITKKNNYLVEEGEKRGITKADFQYIRRLKNGETVTLPSGVVITPEEVIAKGRKGRKMTVLGDTSDASWMSDLAKGSDVLVHEATVSVKKPLGQAYGHSSGRDAGKFAQACGARHLVLNHLCDRGSSVVLDEYVNEAQGQFDGPVIPAVDQLIVDINQEGRDDLKIGEGEAENIVEVERVGIVPKKTATEWIDYSDQVFEKVYPKRVPTPANAFVENNEDMNEDINEDNKTEEN